MIHKIMVFLVRRFLKKTQAWINKTPGAINVSIDIDGKNIILAEKNPHQKNQ